ncbi:MAG: outer membrane protein assembly factor BamD [Fibrobacteria bacterium]|nr:outer membrane protein assembly factor BamD [Fibrobacteria bacterium]
MRHIRLATLAALALVPVLSSCSKSKVAASPEKVCREKYDKASKAFEKGKDVQAQEILRDITISCNGYDFIEDAQYKLAESHFRSEQWMEAETEFGILVENYEHSAHLEEARWKICRSAWEQSPSWDRDPGLTASAIKRYNAYLYDFPAAPHTDSAKADLIALQEKMALRRFKTAQLYLRMDEPLAATMYYNLLFQEYPQSKDVPQARLDVARAYAQLDQFDRARETLDTLRMDSTLAAPFADRIVGALKYIDKAQAKFEKLRAKEAAKAKQGEL